MRIAGEWEIGPEHLSALFEALGWGYDTEEGLVIPNAASVEGMVSRLVHEAIKKRRNSVQGGRFLVRKDPEMTCSWDLFLNIGYIWDNDALTDEERAILLELYGPEEDDDEEDDE